ncbi:hypothetical protein PVK06_039784 [Gossypium arboreum]|uniref:Uncharacterized protein n=1 Tax=Gossypium arboreum TaxID=29729 RepID=A0ABR0N3S2_GOSAR|nr:hypothetical protein PVK06_039784 [Gossypium arboreum]
MAKVLLNLHERFSKFSSLLISSLFRSLGRTMRLVFLGVFVFGEDEREGGVNRARGSVDDKGMGYRRSLIVKCRGGSGGLPIVKDVATGSGSGHEVDAIILGQNNGRLGMNK